jgi:hypothetical protein
MSIEDIPIGRYLDFDTKELCKQCPKDGECESLPEECPIIQREIQNRINELLAFSQLNHIKQ